MQTRRDRYQAYRFVVRRGVYALLHGDPDSPESPLRRLGIASVAGLVIAVLVAAVFGIIGLLRPATSAAWRQPGSLVVEKDTGTRYVLVGGVLHPVLNYASARLVLGASSISTVLVSRSSLTGVPRGLPVGITAAPDTLPSTGALARGPWTVCGSQATGSDGTVRPTAVLDIGRAVAAKALGAAQAVFVRGPDGTIYLVWQGTRLRITDRAVLAALGYQGQDPALVADAWLSAVPAGPDLTFLTVSGRGRLGPVAGGVQLQVGQVLVVRTPGVHDAYYLVLPDGVAPLTPLDAALVIGDPASKAAYPAAVPAPIPVSAADVAAAPVSAATATIAGYPATPPDLVDPSGSDLCASFRDPANPGSGAAVTVATATTSDAVALRSAGDSATADAVRLAVGAGVIAQNIPTGGVTSGALYLITDLGVKYPVPSTDALGSLGYSAVTPVPVSSALLALVPTGPALDPAAAQRYQAAVLPAASSGR